MVEIYSMSFTHSSLIINIILICLYIKLNFCVCYYLYGAPSLGSIWAWLLVLVFLPIIGFILYLLLGRQIQRNRILN